jgi:hypothetical protein
MGHPPVREHPGRLRAIGVLLLLPLAGAGALSVAWAAAGVGCRVECGDTGRGLFVLVLLSTPPGALGLLALAAANGRPTRLPGALQRLAIRVAVAAVLLCALVLVGVAIAAGVGAVNRVADGPERYTGREGVFMLVVAVVLGAMAAGTVLALSAAWRRRGQSRSG